MMNAMPSQVRPLGNRRNRRAVVVATYAVFAAITASALAVEVTGVSTVLREILFFGVMISAMGAFVVLKRNVRGIANLPDTQLDERQLMERNRSYRTAYRLFSCVMVAAAAYGYTTLGWHFAPPAPDTTGEANVVLWWIFLLASSLPSSIMAWTEPDGEEDADAE